VIFCDFQKSVPCFLPFLAVIFTVPSGERQIGCSRSAHMLWQRTFQGVPILSEFFRDHTVLELLTPSVDQSSCNISAEVIHPKWYQHCARFSTAFGRRQHLFSPSS